MNTQENKTVEMERDKVNIILVNTILNGLFVSTENSDCPRYDFFKEAIMWAKSEDYFPNKSDEEILSILRQYEEWRSFEETCQNMISSSN